MMRTEALTLDGTRGRSVTAKTVWRRIQYFPKVVASILKMACAKTDDETDRNDEMLALESIFCHENNEDTEDFVRFSAEKLSIGDSVSKWVGCLEVSPSVPETNCDQSDGGFVIFEDVRVSVVSPISLYFELPPGYPSESPPCYSLACDWLSEEQVSSQMTSSVFIFSPKKCPSSKRPQVRKKTS